MSFRKRFIPISLCILLLVSLISVPAFGTDGQNTAAYGTPVLGTNDPLWETTEDLTVAIASNGGATGVGKVLWDEEFLYVRVVVTDSDVYAGEGPASNQWMYDGIEFFVGPGTGGANQYRLNSTGVNSGQTLEESWASIEDSGYILEAKVAKKSLTFESGALVTFEIQICDSTSAGNDRFSVITWCGEPDQGYNSDAGFIDSLLLVKAETEPEVTEPEVTEPEVTEPEVTEPEETPKEVYVALGDFVCINKETQMGWCSDGFGSQNYSSIHTIDTFLKATHLVLEFEEAPVADMQVIWQGDANGGMWWNQKDSVIVGGGTETKYTFKLDEILADYDKGYQDCTQISIMLGYYEPNVEGLKLSAAYLVLPMEEETGIPAEAAPIETASDWAVPYIEEALEFGIVTEEIQGTYQANITRAEFCRVAVHYIETVTDISIDEFLAEQGLAIDPAAFTDTSDEAILAANILGIVNGRGDGIFDPDSEINRQEAAAMLTRLQNALGVDTSDAPDAGFEDAADIADWAVNPVNYLKSVDVMQGMTDTTFVPAFTYTREQSITTFLRLVKLSVTEIEEPAETDEPAETEEPAEAGEPVELGPVDINEEGLEIAADSWGFNIVIGTDAEQWPYAASALPVAFAAEKDATYRITLNITSVDADGVRVRWISADGYGEYTSADTVAVNDNKYALGEVATVIPAYFENTFTAGETADFVLEVTLDGAQEADGLIGNIAVRGQSGKNITFNSIAVEKIG